ncbi:MAG: preprotein translocase subunit SecG [Anaerolineae bacterium]|nr:preprotein translocase subunit SecG [Gemmatimonadaceae bacterium]
MYTALIFLLILDSIILIGSVLLQAGKGGGLAASFGGAASSADAFVGTRQAANLLTRTSWWSGGVFLFLGLVLSIMSTRASTPTSVLDGTFQRPAQTAPAPSQANPAVPLEAVPSKTTPTPAPPPTKQP